MVDREGGRHCDRKEEWWEKAGTSYQVSLPLGPENGGGSEAEADHPRVRLMQAAHEGGEAEVGETALEVRFLSIFRTRSP